MRVWKGLLGLEAAARARREDLAPLTCPYRYVVRSHSPHPVCHSPHPSAHFTPPHTHRRASDWPMDMAYHQDTAYVDVVSVKGPHTADAPASHQHVFDELEQLTLCKYKVWKCGSGGMKAVGGCQRSRSHN